MFKVGQKVVCINSNGNPMLIQNEIYTCNGYDDKFNDEIQLIELGIACNGKYYCAYAYRFRPIDYTFGEKLAEEIQEEINQEQLVNA